MRDQNLHATKQTIRKFLADQRFFDDGALVELLDAARGRLLKVMRPCHCLVGMTTIGYSPAFDLAFAIADRAEDAFFALSAGSAKVADTEADHLRCRRLIPMIKSELRNRARSLTQSLEPRRRFVEPTIDRATRFEFVD